jgi:hypothetical protein
MALVEANGYQPNGVILANDARAHLRNARAAVETTASRSTRRAARSRSRSTPVGAAAALHDQPADVRRRGRAGRVVGVVGDFSQAVLGIRKDISLSFSDQATIDVGGTLHHLWQQNKVASRWEMRVGFVAHDLNRAFAAIINAAKNGLRGGAGGRTLLRHASD